MVHVVFDSLGWGHKGQALGGGQPTVLCVDKQAPAVLVPGHEHGRGLTSPRSAGGRAEQGVLPPAQLLARRALNPHALAVLRAARLSWGALEIAGPRQPQKQAQYPRAHIQKPIKRVHIYCGKYEAEWMAMKQSGWL